MAKDQDDEIACPVCGKIVGIDVSSCPYCGAEFEHDEEEPVRPSKAKAEPVTSDDSEDVACPVCGAMVGIDVVSCPKCGAEFEEEEIEEVIEVEEKTVFEAEPEPAPAKAKPAQKPKAAAKPSRPAERPRPKPSRAAKKREPEASLPSSIMDFRVIGVALIILGLVGTQIALMIDWYWSWVPPIEDNLAMFIIIPVVLLVVGLLAFMLIKKAMSSGKEVSGNMPGLSLSLFLFGILALIIVVLWDPINSAMQDSREMIAGVFAVALVLGIVLVVVGSRRASSKASCD